MLFLFRCKLSSFVAPLLTTHDSILLGLSIWAWLFQTGTPEMALTARVSIPPCQTLCNCLVAFWKHNPRAELSGERTGCGPSRQGSILCRRDLSEFRFVWSIGVSWVHNNNQVQISALSILCMVLSGPFSYQVLILTRLSFWFSIISLQPTKEKRFIPPMYPQTLRLVLIPFSVGLWFPNLYKPL